MTLFLLQRLAELLCTLGRVFKNPRLLATGTDFLNFVQSQKNPQSIYRIGAAATPMPQAGQAAIDSTSDGTVRRVVYSSKFQEVVSRAAAIDPEIGDIEEYTTFLRAPGCDGRFDQYLAMKALLPAGPIDTVVCVPWLRTGGADLVACLVANALVGEGQRVVILRLDNPHLEREDWIPNGVAAPDLSSILKQSNDDEAEELLYALFMGIDPKRVINVNSRLAWQTYRRFGSRLANHVNLYAYLFCWDQTRRGTPVGYPSIFFAATAPSLRLLFTDTQFLRSELTRIYQPPEPIRDRMIVLDSPARSMVPDTTSAETGVRSRDTRARPTILWAGRLDRQKRFDLVIDIARRRPDWDVLCWGEALMDAPPDRTQLPKNLELRGNFKTYEELPLDMSDCWLFTSDWEGMPTLLIELAVRGVAIVASAVGGVPELIDETTGWPVAARSSAEAYVEALQDALARPDARIERAQALQTRAKQKHDAARYAAHLRGLLSEAEARPPQAAGPTGHTATTSERASAC